MPDAVGVVKKMQRIAVEAMESTKPVNICFGEVVSVSPLQINVEQKMTLGEKQLILSRNVTDFTTEVTVQWQTEQMAETHCHAYAGSTENGGEPLHSHTLAGTTETAELSHGHDITGRKEITMHNALKVNEKVILLRQQGGQKYIVLDRIGVM